MSHMVVAVIDSDLSGCSRISRILFAFHAVGDACFY